MNVRVIAVFFYFLITAYSCERLGKEEIKPIIDREENGVVEVLSDTITITAVGDIMLGSNYPNASKLPGQNILQTITPYLKKDTDIVVGNLEGTLFDGRGTAKECNNPNFCFFFRTPFSYGKYLVDAGFDFLSIANNHIRDFGTYGKKATQNSLDSLGIGYAGVLEQCEYSIKEKNGITYAFIGAGHNSRLVSVKNYSNIIKIINEVRSKADIVIVLFHGGAEGVGYQNVPHGVETYLGENRGNIKEFAYICIDSGADIVIGSGPHVTRAVELYKNKFIAYSLGNFATYGSFNLKGANGKAPILKIKVNKNGDFLLGEVLSTYQTKGVGYGPLIDEKNGALKYMQTLTAQDFPDGNLVITDAGIIRKLE